MSDGFNRPLSFYSSMLDSDVARVRVDRLREHVKEQKQEAEQRRIDAVEQDQSHAVSESTGKIEAFEEILQYLDAKSGDRDGKQLDRLR